MRLTVMYGRCSSEPDADLTDEHRDICASYDRGRNTLRRSKETDSGTTGGMSMAVCFGCCVCRICTIWSTLVSRLLCFILVPVSCKVFSTFPKLQPWSLLLLHSSICLECEVLTRMLQHSAAVFGQFYVAFTTWHE